ncbi:MAG: VOC family protein [Spirochaetia bacterium]|jgi:PhnB protein
MTGIAAYLTFEGNCREAMTFYKDCLGGDLALQSVGETPAAAQFPPEAKNKIMHAALTNGPITLYASDNLGNGSSATGNNFSLCINCSSEAEVKKLFSKLSVGGKVGHPLEEQFWGAIFGDFTDKFGIRWMTNWDKPKK